jgi:demethylmenaquinone methyltransferase/2-methoxy-6-polyprenyl-1,4-benzoquinol methylase
MPTEFAHDKIVPDQQRTLHKKEQVAEMFNNIAGKYDFLNRFLSCGIDIIWRKKAIQQLKALQPQTILDVATGTAEVALMTYARLKPQKIIGIDISEGMLNLGKQKIEKAGLSNNIILQQGDSEHIDFEDNSFDAITVSFRVRNFENLLKGLRQMHRVLKPGGKIVILVFSKPRWKPFQMIYNLYLSIIAPAFAQLFPKNKKAYKYLNNSVRAFPEGKQFLTIMLEAGFTQTYL